jgi:MFS family permease
MEEQKGEGSLSFTRDRLTWTTYLLLGYFAYLVNAFGPLMTFLRAELNLSYTVTSLHSSAFALGSIISGLLADRAIRRWGRRIVCWAGACGIGLGAVLLTLFSTPVLTIASALLMGILGALVVILVQSTLSDRHGEQRSIAFAESNVVASIGGALAPLLIGYGERIGLGWRSGLWFPVLALVPLMIGFVREPFPDANGTNADARSSRTALPPSYWAYWIVILLVVSTEFCILLWSADFLATVVGLSRSAAATTLSFFLVAVVVGRAAGSQLTRHVSSPRLFLAALAVVGIGFPLYWLASWAPLNIAGLFIAGLGVANLYPLALSLAVSTAPEQADLASARCSLASGLAILLAPLVLASLADLVGIYNAYGVVAVLLVLVLLFAMGAHRIATERTPSTVTV